MTGQQRVLDVLVEAVDTLTEDFDLIDFLYRLSTRCVELLDVDAAGVMIVDQHGELQLIAASDEHTRLLELFALQHNQGPCVRCYHTGQAQLNISLTSGAATLDFGPFAAQARTAGFTVTHALPMKLRHEVIGAVNLFGTRLRRLSDTDIQIGQAIADVATIAILQQRTIEQGHLEKAQLQAALASRVIIEQAKGVLSERYNLSLDETFSAMRTYARPHHLRLTELAQHVIDNTFDGDFTQTDTP
ncbi:GAF and ANTAR domain-containing protein (plasmid) [Streptomyces sp. BH-SS-21]|uniref:GAF and ANTAR domain-containing protein n=1 Tax=Streptomyces liliiviolaceus TaxID=2823109 RepID=A0A940Y4X9_9ACTN|nr:GAF and ANTAR domain-containing protein [Streptomyces liliiviolaceus]MBQ0855683.1 GAF and ANTAR domain-containing protein [Streptomyces liliiviolaceus]